MMDAIEVRLRILESLLKPGLSRDGVLNLASQYEKYVMGEQEPKADEASTAPADAVKVQRPRRSTSAKE